MLKREEKMDSTVFKLEIRILVCAVTIIEPLFVTRKRVPGVEEGVRKGSNTS